MSWKKACKMVSNTHGDCITSHHKQTAGRKSGTLISRFNRYLGASRQAYGLKVQWRTWSELIFIFSCLQFYVFRALKNFINFCSRRLHFDFHTTHSLPMTTALWALRSKAKKRYYNGVKEGMARQRRYYYWRKTFLSGIFGQHWRV